MPTVRLEHCRRGMIAAYNDDVWLECNQARNQTIDLFDDMDFARKVAIFARRIGLYHVEVEEIEIVPILL